jgi:hypothetical protein
MDLIGLTLAWNDQDLADPDQIGVGDVVGFDKIGNGHAVLPGNLPEGVSALHGVIDRRRRNDEDEYRADRYRPGTTS